MINTSIQSAQIICAHLVTHQTQLYKPSGPFGLDPNIIADIERDWVRADQLEVRERPRVDISVLFEPIKILPTRDGLQYPQERFDQLLARSRQMQQQSHTTPLHPTMTGVVYGFGVSPYMMSPQQQSAQMQQQSPHFAGGHLNYHNQSGGNSANNSPNLASVLPKHDPHLIKIIKAISSSDTMKARAAINELTEIIDSAEKQAVLRDYEELFVQNVLAQLKNQSQVALAESLVVYQPLLSILYSFFHSKTLGRTLSIACFKNLMAALLNLMADQKIHNGEDGQYNKVINGICLKVLDKANFTYLNCALIRLLRETCPGACSPKFTDLLMKCIWRNVKMLPERSNELNYDAVIMEVHEFMSALPSSWWQTRPSDTALRTVKTIIHNMAKVKGNAIMQHLSQIPTHSELHAYLIKILKNLQREGNLPPGGGDSPQRPVKDVAKENARRLLNQKHETMAHIFQLLSDKDTKHQGLYKLYELKSQHPDLDLSLYLQGASASFQKFIEEGMADIERNTNVGDQQISPLKARTMRNGKQANHADVLWLCEVPEMLVDVSDQSDISENEEFADLEKLEMLRKYYVSKRRAACATSIENGYLKELEELQKRYESDCREQVEIYEFQAGQKIKIQEVRTKSEDRGGVKKEKKEQRYKSEHRKNLTFLDFATNEESRNELKHRPAGQKIEIREIRTKSEDRGGVKIEKKEQRDKSEHRKNLTFLDFATNEESRTELKHRPAGQNIEIRGIRTKSEDRGGVKIEKKEQRYKSEHRNEGETRENLTLCDFAANEDVRNELEPLPACLQMKIQEIPTKSEYRGNVKHEKIEQCDKFEHRKNLTFADIATSEESRNELKHRPAGQNIEIREIRTKSEDRGRVKIEKTEQRYKSEHRNEVETRNNLTPFDFATYEDVRSERKHRPAGLQIEIREIRTKSEDRGGVKKGKKEQPYKSEHRNEVETRKNLTLFDYATYEDVRCELKHRPAGLQIEIREIRTKSEDRGVVDVEIEENPKVPTTCGILPYQKDYEFHANPVGQKLHRLETPQSKSKNQNAETQTNPIEAPKSLEKPKVLSAQKELEEVKKVRCELAGLQIEIREIRTKSEDRGVVDVEIEEYPKVPTTCGILPDQKDYEFHANPVRQKLHRLETPQSKSKNQNAETQTNPIEAPKSLEKPKVQSAQKEVEEVKYQNAKIALEEHQTIQMRSEGGDDHYQREQDMQREKAYDLIISNHKASWINGTFCNKEWNDKYESFRKAQLQKELDEYDQLEPEEKIKRIAHEQHRKYYNDKIKQYNR